jgi:CMP-N-acetylneuraminic acid synthetase
MGDAGEGLVDAEARIQERMEELERARREKDDNTRRDAGALQADESLRLARVELERQLQATSNERRRTQLQQAIADIDRKMKTGRSAGR